MPSYGVLAALGILAALSIAWILGRRRGLDSDFILDAVFWAVAVGFVGARLAYVLVSWREFLRAPAATLFSSGGGVYLAGFLAGGGAVALLARRRRVDFRLAADVFAPALALGHVFGRVGCHLAGCCWGSRTTGALSPLSVSYPKLQSPDGQLHGSWPFLDHLARGWVGIADSCSRPVVAVQLLEAGFNFGVFALLFLLSRRRRVPGEVALAYVALYALGRFGFEFLRGDAERGVIGPLSVSQWLCAGLLLILFVRLWKTRWARGAPLPGG